MIYPSSVFSFITGPIRVEASVDPVTYKIRTILTHLQKFSRFGFMLTKPFGFHFWLFWKLQNYKDSTWVPGSEQGIYFWLPGYRWDADLGMIWTWGYFGLRWD